MFTHSFTPSLKLNRRCSTRGKPSGTYKSRLVAASKHCSQKTALRGCLTLSADVESVRGRPPTPPPMPPAPSEGELIPAPHLFSPPVEIASSSRPPLDPDIFINAHLFSPPPLNQRHSFFLHNARPAFVPSRLTNP